MREIILLYFAVALLMTLIWIKTLRGKRDIYLQNILIIIGASLVWPISGIMALYMASIGEIGSDIIVLRRYSNRRNKKWD